MRIVEKEVFLMPVSEAQKKSAQKWDAANLDRVSIAMPKGMKDTFAKAIRICELISDSFDCFCSPTNPMDCRYSGVIANTITSPIASWKPSCAPPWNIAGCTL